MASTVDQVLDGGVLNGEQDQDRKTERGANRITMIKFGQFFQKILIQ